VNGVDSDVVTSVSERPRAPVDDDVETSSPASSRFLVADVSQLEASAAESEPPPASVESVAGTGWQQEIEKLESSEASSSSVGLSFSPLFAPGERALIEQIEQSIAHGDHSDALGMCDAAISRLLSGVASIVAHDGHKVSAHDPALPLLLGLDGRRYLAFRALARRARQIGDVGLRDALESYAFLLEARVAFGQWDALRGAVGATSVPPAPHPTPPPPSVLPPLPRGTLSPPGTGAPDQT
jgi:hypothetical protein